MCLRKQFCKGEANICSLFSAVDKHVSLNNVKVTNVEKETQQWVLSALLWSYKIFRIVVNNIKLLRSPYKVPNFSVRLQRHLEFLKRFS